MTLGKIWNLPQCLPLLNGGIMTGSITKGSCEDLEESQHAKHPELGPRASSALGGIIISAITVVC